MYFRHSLILLLTISWQIVFSQTTTLRGTVTDADNNAVVEDASVILSGTSKFAATAANGVFVIPNLAVGKYTLVVSHAGFLPTEQKIEVKETTFSNPVLKVDVQLKRDPTAPVATPTTELPTVTLDEAESETEGAGEIANLLHSSRDAFQNVSGFAWSTFRFRERGYDSGLFQVFLNGIPFNDPESGSAFFGEFGGLNDVLRNRTNTVGLDAAEFAFAGLGGASFIDLRASVQRKQIRASYASTNRLYRNRVMFTANSGLMPGGWAVSFSASRRWAEEGYVEGTFFEGYSYFLSIDKKFNDKHALNLVVLGAPSRRGRTADSFEEMFDIAGFNYYNPLWGYQNDKKRNAQVSDSHQPIGMLRYDFKPSRKTSVMAVAYGQVGPTGFTRILNVSAPNPAPDFNRRLPSSFPDSTFGATWGDALRADEGLRQINWAALYNANRRTPTTVLNADGQAGNTISGNQSVYVLENNKTYNTELGANVTANHSLNDRVTIQGGGFYQWYEGRNYKVVEDLLGGEFWTDVDFFSNFDRTSNPLAGNSDIRIPNNVVRQGETFGYDYNENIRRSQGWAQIQANLRKIQLFASAEVGNSTLWRTGFMQNGRFPNNSLGDSKKVSFNTYGVKGGIVYKVNGRNYVYGNGYIGTRAPQFRNVFISPRTRDQVLPDVPVSNVQSIEGGFIHRSPQLKLRFTTYLTRFTNETESIFASAQTTSRVLQNVDVDNPSVDQFPVFFGAALMTGVGRKHAGAELGIEYKINPSWSITAAGATGRHQYTARPNLFLSLDNGDAAVIDVGTVYQENFYVPRSPQTAASLSLRYDGKRFWSVSVTGNYADDFWYDFDRMRRTASFVDGVDANSSVFRTINDQIKAPAAYTMDIFGSKSWKIGNKFIYLNIGINNLLNNQDIVISGRDSYRNAFRRDVSDKRFYTTEVLYAFGLNYFAQLAFKI